jgi:hypothetical protein
MDDKTTNTTLDAAPAAPESATRQGPITLARAIAVTAAASLLIGIIVGPIIANNHAQGAATTDTPPEHTISVSGSGLVSVSPDVADVYLGVVVTKPTAKDARSAAATQMTAVIAAIKKLGIADKDINTTNVSLAPVYDYNSGTSRLTGYQFGNTVKVTVRDIARVADVVDDSVAAGATTVQGISFRLDNPKTVEAQARNLAMTDARAKADALAAAAGVQIKGVASISEVTSSSGPVYYAAPAMLDSKAAGVSTPIQTGSTDISIQVTVSYLIG